MAIHPRLYSRAPSAQLTALVTNRAARRHGVGGALTRAAAELARAAGCEKLYVRTNRRRQESPPFYRSLGFEETHFTFDLRARAASGKPPVRRPDPSPLAGHWTLDPDVTFLNHGAFGACPGEVLALQTELRARMERDPIDFLVRAIEPLLDEARAGLGAFLHADPDDLAFVDNATAGVNTVLRSLVLAAR